MEESWQPQNPLREILSIEAFRAKEEEIVQLYSRAYALPQFFLENLLSAERVVKCFTGKEALIEAFYYQLMKLALEVEVEGKNYIQVVSQKFIKYDYIDEGELQDQIFTDFQYRKFLKDFIEIVEKDTIPNFEQKAEQYPIIDTCLKRIFKVIVPYPLVAALQSAELTPEQSARQLLTFLSNQFDITLSEVGPCFKFEESDMFIFLQSTDEVYVAFNDDYLCQSEEESHLSSTFKCGEGNSFVSKYHSQTAGQASDLDRTVKRFEKSKYWNKVSPLSSGDGGKEIQSRLVVMEELKDISCSGRSVLTQEQSQELLLKSNTNKQAAIFLPETFTFSNISPALQPEPLCEKENKQKLYSQFTSSFILEKLSKPNKQHIQSIKDKYRPKRTSIRPSF